MEKFDTYRMKQALIAIHNHICVAPTDLETAQITQACIEDILAKVSDLYLDEESNNET